MKRRIPALVAAALALAFLFPVSLLPTTAAAADGPTVKVSKAQAGTGGSIIVTGTGWRPRTLLMMLICGRSEPARGVIGGTNSCANADGRAVTTDTQGAFSQSLPVVEPPVPCPCVVHVATVTGSADAAADAVFKVAGHPVEPLPESDGTGRLSVLTDPRLDGSSGLLTWFGAPPTRTLVLTLGNLGTAAVKDPVFQVGTSHGVFAPQWDEQQWQGTIQPGRKARVELPVALAGGAHGDYSVSLKYDGKVLAEQPWGVGRPWGVSLFWVLAGVVVPAALFRVGMAVVDRVRPRGPGGQHAVRHGRGARRLRLSELTLRMPKVGERDGNSPPVGASLTLPWFTPDADPGAVPDPRTDEDADEDADTHLNLDDLDNLDNLDDLDPGTDEGTPATNAMNTTNSKGNT